MTRQKPFSQSARLPKMLVKQRSTQQRVVAFRSGLVEEGHEGYSQAVDSCLDLGLQDRAALAASYWAREEVGTKSQSAIEIINTAVRLAGRAPSSDAEVVLARFSSHFPLRVVPLDRHR
jgi:hypothetical protein